MTQKNNKTKNVIAWILQVLLGLEFILAGQAKFTNGELWSENFANWGYPEGIYVVVGLVELVAAVLLFLPRFSFYSGVVLSFVMLVATITHFVNGEMGIVTAIIMVFLITLAYLRKDKAFHLRNKTIPLKSSEHTS